MEVNLEEEDEEEVQCGTDYRLVHTKYHGINLKEERSYSQEPDKAFKFYLATVLILFVIIYTVQAIMVHRYVKNISIIKYNAYTLVYCSL